MEKELEKPAKFDSSVFILINKPMRWAKYIKKKCSKRENAYFAVCLYRTICDLAHHKGVQIPAGKALNTSLGELADIIDCHKQTVKRYLGKLSATEPPLITTHSNPRSGVEIIISFPLPKPQEIASYVSGKNEVKEEVSTKKQDLLDKLIKSQIEHSMDQKTLKLLMRGILGKEKKPIDLSEEELYDLIAGLENWISEQKN